MIKNKKLVIVMIFFLVLALILVGTYFAQKKHATEIIKSKIKLELPSDSKIINFNYHRWSGDFEAKIQISDQEIESIRNSLINYFKHEYVIENDYSIPNYRNVISWWDMNNKGIIYSFNTAVYGKKHLFFASSKSQEIDVYIVKQNNGKYYLYISCMS